MLTQPMMSENQELQNEKSSLQWDSNPVPSDYEANALSVELLELINIGNLILPECAMNNYPYRAIDVVQCFVV